MAFIRIFTLFLQPTMLPAHLDLALKLRMRGATLWHAQEELQRSTYREYFNDS